MSTTKTRRTLALLEPTIQDPQVEALFHDPLVRGRVEDATATLEFAITQPGAVITHKRPPRTSLYRAFKEFDTAVWLALNAYVESEFVRFSDAQLRALATSPGLTGTPERATEEGWPPSTDEPSSRPASR